MRAGRALAGRLLFSSELAAYVASAKNKAVRNCTSGNALPLLPFIRSLIHVIGISSTGTQHVSQTIVERERKKRAERAVAQGGADAGLPYLAN